MICYQSIQSEMLQIAQWRVCVCVCVCVCSTLAYTHTVHVGEPTVYILNVRLTFYHPNRWAGTHR